MASTCSTKARRFDKWWCSNERSAQTPGPTRGQRVSRHSCRPCFRSCRLTWPRRRHARRLAGAICRASEHVARVHREVDRTGQARCERGSRSPPKRCASFSLRIAGVEPAPARSMRAFGKCSKARSTRCCSTWTASCWRSGSSPRSETGTSPPSTPSCSRPGTPPFERFSSSVASTKVQAPPTWRDIADRWLAVVNDTLIEAQRSEAFVEAQRKMLRSASDHRLQERKIAEAWCEAFHVPTRTEMDEMQRTVIELRRQLRALQRASGPRPPAAAMRPLRNPASVSPRRSRTPPSAAEKSPCQQPRRPPPHKPSQSSATSI